MKLKKQGKIILIVAVIILVIAISFFLYNIFFKNNNSTKIEKLKEIVEYGYVLNSNTSREYQNLFYELEEILHSEEVDEEAYLSKITEMFIVDFYSLEDKSSKYDVGGLDFVYPAKQEDYLEKASNTIYKEVETNINNERKQDLPKVKEVTIESINTVTYYYLEYTDVEAYEVNVSWTYEKDLGYQTSAIMYFVHEEDKLWLVELKEEE